jgi:hypothetical protein
VKNVAVWSSAGADLPLFSRRRWLRYAVAEEGEASSEVQQSKSPHFVSRSLVYTQPHYQHHEATTLSIIKEKEQLLNYATRIQFFVPPRNKNRNLKMICACLPFLTHCLPSFPGVHKLRAIFWLLESIEKKRNRN